MGFGMVRPNPLGGATPPGKTGGPQTFRPNPNQLGGGSAPGTTNQSAVSGAKLFKDQLGIPSFTDIYDKIGGDGTGTREFGNAGAAGEGAAFAKDEVGGWKKNLGAGRSALNKLRHGIADPTRTTGFKNVMRLNNERLAAATEDERQSQGEAASRRGYVGGYNPDRTEQSRLEAIAMAGYEGVGQERKALQDQFAAEGDLYGKDVAGYGSALNAYTDLTKTTAELPTKWLDAYSGLLGGASSGFGDIFRTSSGNVQYDVNNQRDDVAQARRARDSFSNRARAEGASGSF